MAHPSGTPEEPSPLRAPLAMIILGAVVLGAGLAVPDERWQALAWVLGALTAGIGLVTLVYARVERHVPVPRRDDRR